MGRIWTKTMHVMRIKADIWSFGFILPKARAAYIDYKFWVSLLENAAINFTMLKQQLN
jgi:hypothetical protein